MCCLSIVSLLFNYVGVSENTFQKLLLAIEKDLLPGTAKNPVAWLYGSLDAQ